LGDRVRVLYGQQDADSLEELRCAGLGRSASSLAGRGAMIHITSQMRVLVAIESVDGRKGIDSLARVCQEKLSEDPFSGCVFIFRSRSGTSIRLLCYDGQGYYLAQKRLSKGRFTWWPESSSPAKRLEAYEAQLLMVAGDVSRVRAAPMWRRVSELK
jgi:transposase